MCLYKELDGIYRERLAICKQFYLHNRCLPYNTIAYRIAVAVEVKTAGCEIDRVTKTFTP